MSTMTSAMTAALSGPKRRRMGYGQTIRGVIIADPPKLRFYERFAATTGITKLVSLSNINHSRLDQKTLSHQAQLLAATVDLARYVEREQLKEIVSFIRINLPELACYGMVTFGIGDLAWHVQLDTSLYLESLPVPVVIAGCPVFVSTEAYLNEIFWEHLRRRQGPYNFGDTRVDPRSILNDEQCLQLARIFPNCMSVRLHVHGRIEIMYEDQQALEKDRIDLLESDGPFPTTLHGHDWDMKLNVFDWSASSNPQTTQHDFGVIGLAPPQMQFNHPVCQEPHGMQPRGCAGLRIRLPGADHDVWTTTTHGLMRLPIKVPPPREAGKQYKRESKLAMKVRSRLANIFTDIRRGEKRLFGKVAPLQPTQVSRVLDQPVYKALSSVKVGRVNHTYDPVPYPDTLLRWPMGIDHDLSLIAAEPGDALPVMMPVPECAELQSTFATNAQILDPENCMCFNAFHSFFNDTTTFEGGFQIKSAARDALVAATEYHFEHRHLKVKRAFLWRTARDAVSMAGGSGGVICLGHYAAKTCQAAVFQNYQTYDFEKNSFWELDYRSVTGSLVNQLRACSYKGGFMLPKEVQEATIIVQPQGKSRSVSGQ